MKSLFQLILDDCRRLVVIAVVGVVGRRRGFGFLFLLRQFSLPKMCNEVNVQCVYVCVYVAI